MRTFLLIAFGLHLTCVLPGQDFPEIYNTEKAEHPPMSAAEAVRTAMLPKDFRLEVFAAEPDVQQPISIAFDQQDRLWVAECYTFAERPLRWDMKLRDRILVLEDTDNDGRSDVRTVFWDKGKRLTSVLPGKGGVWALCAPQLVYIPDADNDLVPDSEPVVMLDGFDAQNIGHNIVNGLKWGADGWLYGRHGITRTSLVGTPETPRSRRIAINCSIWRFHPETRTFEVFCNGGTNPWGMDWNAHGQLFYTNTVIGHLWHAIPGAYYKRMFGAHLNPYVYEMIPHTADHYHWDTGAENWGDSRHGITKSTSKLGGGHAHMGCLIYQGGVWPKAYHGQLFTCNLHGRRVNRERLRRQGVGYVATHEPDFLMMKDPWFRGLDLITGPDGQVWMNDWSDTGECHDNDGIHRASGRIYRIVYHGADKGEVTTQRPEWLVKRDSESLLNSPDEAKVAMAVRWLSEDDPDAATKLLSIASANPAPMVRMELAAALQRLAPRDRFAIAAALSNVEVDATDRQQPLLIWYGIEKAIPNYPKPAIQLAINSKHPKLTKLITRRLSEDYETKPELINQLIAQANGTISEAILEGISEGFSGWRKAAMPIGWQAFSEPFKESHRQQVSELSLLFGDGRTRGGLLRLLQNKNGDAAARRAALNNLLTQPEKDLLPILLGLTNDKALKDDVVRGLAAYDSPDAPKKLVRFAQSYSASRSIAIDTLVSRVSYARVLMKSIESGALSSNAISPLQARQIVNLGDPALSKQLRDLWGEIRETPAEKLAEIESWKSRLTPEVIANADQKNGRQIFAQSCGACHQLYGEGGRIGPDLTGSDRHSLDYLLDNTVNPNDVVPADYRLTVITLKDGRVISGVVPEQSKKTITIQTTSEKIVVVKSDIAKQEVQSNSLMPEGLLKALSEDAVEDLIAYLMSK